MQKSSKANQFHVWRGLYTQPKKGIVDVEIHLSSRTFQLNWFYPVISMRMHWHHKICINTFWLSKIASLSTHFLRYTCLSLPLVKTAPPSFLSVAWKCGPVSHHNPKTLPFLSASGKLRRRPKRQLFRGGQRMTPALTCLTWFDCVYKEVFEKLSSLRCSALLRFCGNAVEIAWAPGSRSACESKNYGTPATLRTWSAGSMYVSLSSIRLPKPDWYIWIRYDVEWIFHPHIHSGVSACCQQ